MSGFSTFNPSAMSAELLEATFAEREPLAERLVEIFEESARGASKHNALLVGPRGIGKSHLVALVYNRLKAKRDLADRLAIAYLREDEWGINSFLDLLLRMVRAISQEEGVDHIANLALDLSGLNPAESERRVWTSLQHILGDKTLLLIIENLDSVFAKIGEQGQRRLRAVAQTYPKLAIFATTPALFSGVSTQVSPFYGFFEVIHLRPLSREGAITLLKKLAIWNKDEPTAAFLGSPMGRARVRAVQHLAGGNHRIFVLFYEFLSQDRSENLVAPLLKTVDALTPYYQSQMSLLSPQQQKIVNFLCEYQRPATVTTIARDCLITPQTAASQLRHLLKDRYVRADRIGRESFYELAEPLLRICVEAKSHDGRPLDLLVEFIRFWFSREELELRISSTAGNDSGFPYFVAALKEYDAHDTHTHLTPEIAALCAALSRANDQRDRLNTQALELAELSKIAEDWSHYARGMEWLAKESEAIATLESALNRHPESVEVLGPLAALHAKTGTDKRAEELIDRAIGLARNEMMPSLLIQKGIVLTRVKRHRDALAAFDQAIQLDPSLAPMAAINKAAILDRLEQYEAVCETLRPHLYLADRVPHMFLCYGEALLACGKPKEALEYLQKAATGNEWDSRARANLGVALIALEQYDEALTAIDRAIDLDATIRPRLALFRCDTLLGLNKHAEAVETVTPEDLSHTVFHRLLKLLNRRPRQEELEHELVLLRKGHDSEVWQEAFRGGLIEFASFCKDFDSPEDLDAIATWNGAIQQLFADQEEFSLLSKLFNVLTRVKVLKERKALLELPREQRRLIMDKDEEVEDLPLPKTIM